MFAPAASSDVIPALDLMISTQTEQMAKLASKTSVFGPSFGSETCALVRPLSPLPNTRHVRRDLEWPHRVLVTVTLHRYLGPPDIDIVPAKQPTLSPIRPHCNVLCKVGERNFGVRAVVDYDLPFLDKR